MQPYPDGRRGHCCDGGNDGHGDATGSVVSQLDLEDCLEEDFVRDRSSGSDDDDDSDESDNDFIDPGLGRRERLSLARVAEDYFVSKQCVADLTEQVCMLSMAMCGRVAGVHPSIHPPVVKVAD